MTWSLPGNGARSGSRAPANNLIHSMTLRRPRNNRAARGTVVLHALLSALVVLSFLAYPQKALADEPAIDVWYGDPQSFGQLGNPQRWVNILGNVQDPDGVASLTYALNSGPDLPLSMGPDDRRLLNEGDFNIEIDYSDLNEGYNQVVITATDTLSNSAATTVSIQYTAGMVWPPTFTADWSAVGSIQEAAQVVDGLWTLEVDGVRPAVLGYNRGFVLGDELWMDYEVTVPITIHGIDQAGFQPPSGAPGIGVIARWLRHTLRELGEQPRTNLMPVGGGVWYDYLYDRLTLTDFDGLDIVDTSGRQLDLGARYLWKLRVQTLPIGQTLYGTRVWRDGDPEPATWDLAGTDDTNDLQNGSVIFLAHHVDATFGNVHTVPAEFPEGLMPDVVSDDFSTESLDTDTWTFVDPVQDGSYAMTGSQVAISVPADVDHDIWSGGNNAPRLMQPVANTDLDCEAKCDTIPEGRFQLQGILIEEDPQNFIRCDFYSDGSQLYFYAASFVDNNPTPRVELPIPAPSAPLYLRVIRVGNTWVGAYSRDGMTWTVGVTFSHVMTVNAVGIYAANAMGSPIPAYTGVFDYFFSRIVPEPPVDDPPTANADTAMTDEDTPVVIDLLANDIDPDDTVLHIEGLTDPANGSVVNDGGGVVTYTPDPDFYGSDSFMYAVVDPKGNADTATVSITVNLVNDAPVCADDIAVTSEDTPVVIDVLANDSDVEGDALVVDSISTSPQKGAAQKDPAGNTVTYTPAPDFFGEDSFQYTVSDGKGGLCTATVTVMVKDLNDGPVAIDDAATTDEDTPVNIDAADNDLDIDGDHLTITMVSTPRHGAATVGLDNFIRYVPDLDYNSTFDGPDTFTYTISDGKGGSDSAQITITINPVPDNPIAPRDYAETPEDTPVLIDVLANDFDPDGDPVAIDSVEDPPNGEAADNGDGTITYTPDPDWNGVDTFLYTITDGTGHSDSTTVTVTVHPVNDPPVCFDDFAETHEDITVLIIVTTNDIDVDGDELNPVVVSKGFHGGAVELNFDGTIAYTPKPDFCGEDWFTYEISDGNGGSCSAQVTVDITCGGDPPVAVDDTASTIEDEPVTIFVCENDYDVDENEVFCVNDIIKSPAGNGDVVIKDCCELVYVPYPDFNGIDTFQYRLKDDDGYLSNYATVTVTVDPVDDDPVAVKDEAQTDEDTSIVIEVTANDYDPDGDPLCLVSVFMDPNGVVEIVDCHNVRYTPNHNWHGVETFFYTITDGTGRSDSAKVTVTVNAVNDCPIGVDDAAETAEDTPVTIDVIANDIEVDGEEICPIEICEGPGHGTAKINPDCTITYTPDADYCGPDSLVYRLTDNVSDENCDDCDDCTEGDTEDSCATVTITVNCIPDCPRGVDDEVETDEDTPATFDVIANDIEVDGEEICPDEICDGPDHGTANINPDCTITYTPDPDYCGTDSFVYRLTDGVPDENCDSCDDCDGSDTDSCATVTITVKCINDPPVCYDDTAGTSEDTFVDIDVLANDTDVDGDALTIASVSDGEIVNNKVRYTPPENLCGDFRISYTATDGEYFCSADVIITVTAVNDPPECVDDTATVQEGGTIVIDVVVNDLDVDLNPDTACPPDEPPRIIGIGFPKAGGAFVELVDNKIRYYAPDDFCDDDPTDDQHDDMIDVIRYKVTDAHGGTDEGDVTITVTAINDPPVAVPDEVETAKGTPVVIEVTNNDYDADCDPLCAKQPPCRCPAPLDRRTYPSDGDLAFDSKHCYKITYIPDQGFIGEDYFCYQATDGFGGQSECVKVTIKVLDVTPPVQDLECERREDAVHICWENRQGDPDSINIYRRDDPDGSFNLVETIAGASECYVDRTPLAPGDYCYQVEAVVTGEESFRPFPTCCLSTAFFIRGDINADAHVDIGDPISLIHCLFNDGPCPTCEDAADCNNDGQMNIADSVFALNFLFLTGEDIPAPFPVCGGDPVPAEKDEVDELGCEFFPPCD